MDLIWRQRAAIEQSLFQMRQVAIRIAVWRYPLVDLEDMHRIPWHAFATQGFEHDPGRRPTAHREQKAPTLLYSCPGSAGDGRRRRRCGGLRRGKRFDAHQ